MSDETTNTEVTAPATGDPVGIADSAEVDVPVAAGIADGDAAENTSATSDQPAEAQADAAKPEPYELTAPDGFDVPADNLKGFEKICNEIGLTKEQADKLLGWHKEQNDLNMADSQQQSAQLMQDWSKEIQADPEFGGKNWQATVASARKAFDAFDTDGSLRTFLRETGYQHNPMIIRTIARVGRAMGEHNFIGQNGEGNAASEQAALRRIYPSEFV